MSHKLLLRKSGVRLLLLGILAIILVSALVSGCTAVIPAGELADAGPEPVIVVYCAHNFTPRVELDEKYIAEFMEMNPHITVEYEVIPADFDQKLRTALAAGTGPDLFAQWNGDMGTFYAQGAIAPVAFEAIGYDSMQDFMDIYVAPENTLQGAIFEGELYGIPNELSIYGCFINNRLFEEAGLDPDADFPETWEEMLVVAETLTKRDEEGRLIQRGFDFSWSSSVWMFLEYGAMVRQLGGSELNLLTPEAEKAMQYWVDWEANGLAVLPISKVR